MANYKIWGRWAYNPDLVSHTSTEKAHAIEFTEHGDLIRTNFGELLPTRELHAYEFQGKKLVAQALDRATEQHSLITWINDDQFLMVNKGQRLLYVREEPGASSDPDACLYGLANHVIQYALSTASQTKNPDPVLMYYTENGARHISKMVASNQQEARDIAQIRVKELSNSIRLCSFATHGKVSLPNGLCDAVYTEGSRVHRFRALVLVQPYRLKGHTAEYVGPILRFGETPSWVSRFRKRD